ncbi:MAG: hypothetical protein M3O31_00585 [Acidobacteriota bacterium]|nr:hypothetical protein [Acidobacteriota bacterium]
MLHKNVSNLNVAPLSNQPKPNSNPAGLSLVPERQQDAHGPASSLIDLAVITSRRCSSFFAEAAVLVLVFGILDFFILKGRIELAWIAGALGISVALLAASIAMDFSAHRWMRAHP